MPEIDCVYVWRRVYNEDGSFRIKLIHADHYAVKPEHTEPYFAGTVEGEKDTMMFLKLYICSEMQAFFCGHDNDTDENMDYLNTAFTEDLMKQWGQWPDCLDE